MPCRLQGLVLPLHGPRRLLPLHRLDDADLERRPRLLSDNGPSYVDRHQPTLADRFYVSEGHWLGAGELADWLEDQGMRHSRGNYYLPGDLERAVAGFVDHYNHRRYHESLDNLTLADVYFERGARILKRREDIKRGTIEQRRRQHFNAAA